MRTPLRILSLLAQLLWLELKTSRTRHQLNKLRPPSTPK